MKDVISIDLSLAAKLAGIVVHADELMSVDGRGVDRTALLCGINDPEVKAWIESLGALAPVKRRA